MDCWYKFKNTTKIFFAILFLVLLTGCAEKIEIEKEKPTLPQDPAPILINKLSDYIVQTPTKLHPFFVLAIPKSKLFNEDSSNFSYYKNTILDNVAALLKCYEKIDVQVASYVSDKSQNIYRAKSLARKEADQVLNYLWAKEIDARLMYADGYVSGHKKYFIGNIIISFQVFGRN